MHVSFYQNDTAVGEATRQLLQKDIAVFQIHRLAKEEAAHVAMLLHYLAPPLHSKVLDMGCGVGTVARLMKQLRPDLTFVLQNISQEQLNLCPDFKKICGDFHSTAAQNEEFDVVMFNYSIGHGDLPTLLNEAKRLLKKGGVLFIYDLCGPDLPALEYRLHSTEELVSCARGFSLDFLLSPKITHAEHFIPLFGEVEYERIFCNVTPILYRFLRD